ncbi:MAG: hypothetical protein HC938_10205, partial [Nitrospira sp.]|nr:hypothetical protein [Nitrospira sp.]
PELIREALPFGLKTLEGLLTSSPNHRGLLLSAARGFTTYAYLLQEEADRWEEQDRSRARLLRTRVKRLYLRARGYSFRGIRACTSSVRSDAPARSGFSRRPDHERMMPPFLYWAGMVVGRCAPPLGRTTLR